MSDYFCLFQCVDQIVSELFSIKVVFIPHITSIGDLPYLLTRQHGFELHKVRVCVFFIINNS